MTKMPFAERFLISPMRCDGAVCMSGRWLAWYLPSQVLAKARKWPSNAQPPVLADTAEKVGVALRMRNK